MPPERILLHLCCAPCATTVIRRLAEAGFQVHGYFYNPNIQPEKEYYQRLLEVQRLCKLWGLPLEVGDYDWDRWQAEIRGLEGEKEGGERCRVCFRYRLAATARKARELELDAIATTLTISPRKSPETVNPIGREVCEELGLRFHEADWKKKDGFKQSLDVSRELNLYRQHYCGCKYSLKEREEREAQQVAQETRKLVEAQAPKSKAKPEPEVAGSNPRGAEEPAADTRAKWELTPLERKKRRDKKSKPWSPRGGT